MGGHHGHGDGDAHGLTGGWDVWARDPILRVVLGAVVVAAIATIVGVVAMWPTGEGRAAIIENADDLGLISERVGATVDEMVSRRCSYSTVDNPQSCVDLTLTLTEGDSAGVVLGLPELNVVFHPSVPDLEVGDEVVLGYFESTETYFYADRDRRTSLVWLAGLFAIVVIALGRFRGVLALAGMVAAMVVLVAFVAPSALDGNDPLLVSVVAASAIAFVSLYLTHGFSPTTTVALAGTLAALGLTLGLSWAFFAFAELSGLAGEQALVLPAIAENLDVGALVLGGAIIGALGALDDVTVTQVATVAELRYRSPRLPTSELVASGIRVGRDHIASTVNTLLLAYAGASMPLLLLFAVSNQSLSEVANSEVIAVEIVRTLCGSMGLVAAVPITTALAAAVLRPTAEPGQADDRHDPLHFDADSVDQDVVTDGELAQKPTWDDFAPREEGL